MHHWFSSPQKPCRPEGQQTACPSPSLPDTPHPVPTLPLRSPFPSTHIFHCCGSKPVGCHTHLLFFLLLLLALGNTFISSLCPPLLSGIAAKPGLTFLLLCLGGCHIPSLPRSPLPRPHKAAGGVLALPTFPHPPLSSRSGRERDTQPLPPTSLRRRPALLPAPCRLLT